MSNATLADGSIVITVYGNPAPQGSKRAINHKHTGRAVVIESSNDNLKTWRQDVVAAAREARQTPHGWTPTIDGPVIVSLVFTVRKPAGAPKTKRTYPDRKPDVSKLQRAVEDALTDAGVYSDDARIIEYVRLAKVFPFEDPDALDVPGARIVVTPVVDYEPPQLHFPGVSYLPGGTHLTPCPDPPAPDAANGGRRAPCADHAAYPADVEATYR